MNTFTFVIEMNVFYGLIALLLLLIIALLVFYIKADKYKKKYKDIREIHEKIKDADHKQIVESNKQVLKLQNSINGKKKALYNKTQNIRILEKKVSDSELKYKNDLEEVLLYLQVIDKFDEFKANEPNIERLMKMKISEEDKISLIKEALKMEIIN